jgi:hypothetical protein
MVSHHRLLLELGAWLEVERAPVCYLIANRLIPGLSVLARQPGVSPSVSRELQALWEVGIVLAASALVRIDLIREAKDLYQLLKKG